MVGQTVGHYRITAKLGSGGMGDVYRATDNTLHRDVAIKVISPEFANDPERMARFEREAQVLASLTHGSIAAVYGLEHAGTHRALVMELVEGEDLSTRLRRGPLPLDDALRTGARIAEALEAAHEHGVIHRDLKPANVKVLENGSVKLLDFGLAKALEDTGPAHLKGGEAATLSVAATRAGIILGTAAYMSPEQATGMVADKRSDVWSFGVLMFELLTGTRLFEGQTTSHVLADVIRAEIDFTRLPDIPQDVRTLIERCLERDPRRRLRDIREARLVLERAVERGTGPHSVMRTAPMAASQPPHRRRALLVWGAAGLVVAGSLALAGVAWVRGGARVTPPMRVEARLASEALFAPIGPSFDVAPDGSSLVMTVGTDKFHLELRRLNELDSTTLVVPREGSGTEEQPYNPFFSPDGAWIGYALPGELRKVPIGGGTPLTICKVQRSRGAWWGPDGVIVFASSPASGLFRVNAAGGEPQPLTTLNAEKKEATHRWPQVLPDGKAVIFTSHTNPSGGFDTAVIEVVKLATGERTVLLTGGSFARYVPSGHIVYLHNNSLFAVRFDLDRLAVVGQAAPVVQNLAANTAEGAAQFAFASTGLMAYVRGTPPAPVYPIVWVDRTGRTSSLVDEPGTYANPRLSPDGKQLSLTVLKNRNWDIWVHDLERHVSTRATFDEAAESEQVWSPDGRELAFLSEGGERPAAIFRKPADGSGMGAPVSKEGVTLFPQAWSPDGRLLAVTSVTSDIGVLPLSGKDAEAEWILTSPFQETDPAFSPDGRWLAYTSRESGRPEVYARQFPSGTGRWQISNGGGTYARWSGSGRELFYRTGTGLMAVDVDTTGGSLRTGTPRLLFKGDFLGGLNGIEVGAYSFADFDVSRDGTRFIMFPKPVASPESRMGLVTLVTNWFDDLKGAVTTK
jgi:serine/threonine-protein kinase